MAVAQSETHPADLNRSAGDQNADDDGHGIEGHAEPDNDRPANLGCGGNVSARMLDDMPHHPLAGISDHSSHEESCCLAKPANVFATANPKSS